MYSYLRHPSDTSVPPVASPAALSASSPPCLMTSVHSYSLFLYSSSCWHTPASPSRSSVTVSSILITLHSSLLLSQLLVPQFLDFQSSFHRPKKMHSLLLRPRSFYSINTVFYKCFKYILAHIFNSNLYINSPSDIISIYLFTCTHQPLIASQIF